MHCGGPWTASHSALPNLTWGNKKHSGTDRNFLDSYLAVFMWRSKLNNSDLFETILKDIAEIW